MFETSQTLRLSDSLRAVLYSGNIVLALLSFFFFFFRVLHTIFGDSVICHHGTTKEYYFYLLILVKTLINRIVHGVVHVFSGATLIFI